MQTDSTRTLKDLFCDIIVTIAWITGMFVWGATMWGIIAGLMG